MNCMKCGREISPELVFCEECLAEMENYPVKPDTPVVLPPRALEAPVKRAPSRHKLWKPEYTITALRRWVIFLILLCAMLAIGLTISISMLLGYEPLAPLGIQMN